MIDKEEEAAIEKYWQRHLQEVERAKPVPGTKLTRMQAQMLSDDAVVFVQHRDNPVLNATGSVWLLRELEMWNFNDYDVHNVKYLPVACIQAEYANKPVIDYAKNKYEEALDRKWNGQTLSSEDTQLLRSLGNLWEQ